MAVCEHLKPLEDELLAIGFKELARGQVWSKNCREWVYFDCTLDVPALLERFAFPPCVEAHEHLGTHDGSEYGLYCAACHDGIMGYHYRQGKGQAYR